MAKFVFLLLLAVALLPRVATEFDGETFSGSLLTPLSEAPCVRLFHSTGSVGCRAESRDGVRLPLLPIYDRDLPDLAILSSLGRATPSVVAVLEGSVFNGSTVDVLLASGQVGGILVLEDGQSPDFRDQDDREACYSHDVATPQGRGTPSAREAIDSAAGYPWNPHGNGLLGKDFSIPISLVRGAPSSSTSSSSSSSSSSASASLGYADKVRQRAEENRIRGDLGRRWWDGAMGAPVWVASMDFYFGKGHYLDQQGGERPLTSVECLAWRDRDGERSPKCLPLGGQSVWATFGARAGAGVDGRSDWGQDTVSLSATQPEALEETAAATTTTTTTTTSSSSKQGVLGAVLLTASMDSNALFHDAAYGANDAAASLVALLSAADALSRLSEFLDPTAPGSPLKRQIAIAIFQGEEFGFLGSRRFATDIGSFSETLRSSSSSSFASAHVDGEGSFECRSPVSGTQTAAGRGMALCLDPLYPSLAFSSLALSDIEAVVVVDEIAATATSSLSASNQLFVHPAPEGDSAALASTILAAGSSLTPSAASSSSLLNRVKVSPTSLQSDTTSLPPSPLTSFLRARPDITGCVLAGYDTAFTDATYHSHYDKPTTNAGGGGGGGSASSSSFDVGTVATAAEILARTAVALAVSDSNAAAAAAISSADAEEEGGSTVAAALAAIEVDEELVATLLDCLAGTSEGKDSGLEGCAAAALFIEAEAAAVARQAGLGSDTGVDTAASSIIDWGSSPMSYYTSVISSSSGLPVYRRPTNRRGGVAYYSRYAESGGWDDSHGAMEAPIDGGQAVYVIPSGLEMFIRSFLALRCNFLFQSASSFPLQEDADLVEEKAGARAGSAAGASEKGSGGRTKQGRRAVTERAQCSTEDDCGVCSEVSRTAREECVAGWCVCPVAFYHLALDTGLEAEEQPGYFTVTNASKPIFAEPYWGTIGVSLYRQAPMATEIWALAFGLVVTGLSIFVSRALAFYVNEANAINGPGMNEKDSAIFERGHY